MHRPEQQYSVLTFQGDAMPNPQTFENHARTVPGFHMVTWGILAINFFWALYQAVTVFSAGTVIALLVAIALILLSFYARVFALTVQDRVIRLEMMLRLQRLLPADLQARAHELTVKQLVALRFASDVELPELFRKTVAGELKDPKAIKQAIRTWQADYLRV